MRLQMRRVDHDAFGPWAVARESREDAVEDAKPAPPDEADVKRLVWPIILGRVLPLETVADHIDNAADETPIIATRHAMRQWKMRRNPRHLALAEQKQIIHRGLLHQRP